MGLATPVSACLVRQPAAPAHVGRSMGNATGGLGACPEPAGLAIGQTSARRSGYPATLKTSTMPSIAWGRPVPAVGKKQTAA